VSVSADHASGYDAVNNICESIKRAESLDPKAIVGALSKLDNRGILGRYVFDQKDHTIKDGEGFLPVPAAQIQNGKNVIVWPPSLAAGTYTQPPWIKD
jgi:branched-chain amino acid transport system substrate-binding protein